VIDPLDYLWPVADARSPVVGQHVFSGWPPGVADRLTELGWLAEVEAADRILCPECGDHFEAIVARSASGAEVRYYIPCRRHVRVRVPLDARRQLGIQFDQIGGALARSLRLTGKSKELLIQRVWRLGRMVWRGESRDIVFTRGLAWNDSTSVRATIVALHRPIVLVPFALPATDFWRGRMPPVIALDQTSILDDCDIAIDPLAFATAVQYSDSSTTNANSSSVDVEQLKLLIRRQIKAEHKSQLTDDALLAAWRNCGSMRKAAQYLSCETGQAVTKDQVFQAVKRSNGFAEVVNATDSDSIVRTSATARGRRKSKPRSLHP